MTPDTVRLSRIARVINGGTPASDSEYWEGDVPWATPVDLGANHGSSLRTTLRALTPAGIAAGSTIVPARSVLVSTRAPIGYVAVNEVPMAFNQGVKALVPGRQTDAVFLGYAIQANAANLQAAGQGSTFSELSTGALASTRVPAVEVGQQRRIAEFLDRETAQIDELIAKQEQLISTLAERWSSRLERSVLGLGEQAPYGQVQLRYRIGAMESGVSVNSEDRPIGPGEVGVLKTSAVYSGEFAADEHKAVLPEEVDRVSCPVQEGRLIVSRMNTPALIGAAGLVRESHERLFLPDRLWQIEVAGVPAFVHYWTRTRHYREQVAARSAGTSSSMHNLSQDDFKSLLVPWPSIEAQTRIVASLDCSREALENLIGKARAAILLLTERRQALISAAVTGQIDVGGAS